MARRATGKVIEPDGKQRSYALRFTAYGKRRFVSLGRPEDGWTRSKAEMELRHVLADVERGRWTPPRSKSEPSAAREVPSFHRFASEWLAAKVPELADRTVEDYRWSLTHHLLPFFASHPLTSITIQEVDRYRTAKVKEGVLSHNSINKTITRLSQVLEVAVEYGHIAANPAAGRRRRLRPETPERRHVEPEQLMALLDAAGDLGGSYGTVARPLLATLAGAGLRIGEALDLVWADVNLGGRTIRVRKSKTAAGVREVDLTPALAEELATLKAELGSSETTDPVFASVHPGRRDLSRPAKLDRHRVSRRILDRSIRAANENLAEKGIEPIGAVTLHGLRRTYASLRIASGDDPVYVANQIGHTSSSLTMSVYAKAVKRRSRLTGETRIAFDKALEWAEIGRKSEFDGPASVEEQDLPSEAPAWTNEF